MNNYSGKHNLLRFKNACVLSIKGKTESKKCLVIPIEDNHLFMSMDVDSGKPKGVFVDFMAWKNEEPDKYGNTHTFRQSLPKEVREKMTEEEKKAIPFFGNMKPYEQPNAVASYEAPVPSLEEEDLDDLPF